MVSIKPLTFADLTRLNNINCDPWTETFSLKFYTEYLIFWPKFCYKAENCNGDIIGYILGKTEKKYKNVVNSHVSAISVLNEYRRQGIAGKLMKAFEEVSERLGCFFMDLFVRVNNEDAVKMYEHMGWIEYKKIPKYYYRKEGKSADAFEMRKALSKDEDKISLVPPPEPIDENLDVTEVIEKVIGDKTVTIKLFTFADISRLDKINYDPWTEAFSVTFYSEYLNNWPKLCYKAETCDGEIIGYILGKTEMKYRDVRNSHVSAISVLAEYRRKGVATMLMTMFENVSERMGCYFMDLFVRANNETAIQMYENKGWVKHKTISNYYYKSEGKSADAFDMRKALPKDINKKSLGPPTGPKPKESEGAEKPDDDKTEEVDKTENSDGAEVLNNSDEREATDESGKVKDLEGLGAEIKAIPLIDPEFPEILERELANSEDLDKLNELKELIRSMGLEFEEIDEPNEVDTPKKMKDQGTMIDFQELRGSEGKMQDE